MTNGWKYVVAGITVGACLGELIQGIRILRLKKKNKKLDSEIHDLDIRIDEGRKIAHILGIKLIDPETGEEL